METTLGYYYHREPEVEENPDFVVESYITRLLAEDDEYIPVGTFSGRELMKEIIILTRYGEGGFKAIQYLAGIGRGLGEGGYMTIRYT